MGHFLLLRPVEEDSSSVSPNIFFTSIAVI
jgi:hypothetical protein